MSARRLRILVGAAMLAGLAARLAFGFGYWVAKPLTHDEREYLSLARSLASGRGFTYDPADDRPGAERFGRAPGYPVFLALIGAGDRPAPVASVPASVKIAQSLAGALGIGLIGWFAFRAAGPRAAVIASFIAAFYPPLVWICAYALSEAVYSVLALGSGLLLGIAVERGSRSLSMGAGILGGAATLTRPAMLFFFPLAAIWLVWRRRVGAALLLALGALLVIAPWTIRNWSVHERFVLVASEGGITFWTGNHPLARGEGDMAANPQIKEANLVLRERHRGLGPEELEPIYYREALRYILSDPLSWSVLMVKKAFYLVVPIGPSYTLHSMRYLAASVLSYGLVLPFAIAGFVALARRSSSPQELWLLAASAVAVCLVFFPQERFRIPVIDPTLIVAAASFLALRRPSAS